MRFSSDIQPGIQLRNSEISGVLEGTDEGEGRPRDPRLLRRDGEWLLNAYAFGGAV